MSPRAKEPLKKYIRVRGEIPGNQFLFVGADNLPMQRRNVQERLSIYGQKARLQGVRVSPHTFRHTFAKILNKTYGSFITEVIETVPNQFLYILASEFLKQEVSKSATL